MFYKLKTEIVGKSLWYKRNILLLDINQFYNCNSNFILITLPCC